MANDALFKVIEVTLRRRGAKMPVTVHLGLCPKELARIAPRTVRSWSDHQLTLQASWADAEEIVSSICSHFSLSSYRDIDMRTGATKVVDLGADHV